jgi:hypothetical protein
MPGVFPVDEHQSEDDDLEVVVDYRKLFRKLLDRIKKWAEKAR